MAVSQLNGRRSLATLVRELAEESVELMRSEVRLARVEAADGAKAIARGTALVAGGAVLLLLGGLAVLTGVILLIGDQWLPRDRYWLAALIVTLVTGAITAWFMKQGLAQLSPRQLVPDETLSTIRETKHELVAAVRRGDDAREEWHG
jgi:uncharacterized membrane protein YqjE